MERTETLVSISTDGAVLEWNMKKGLVMSTLMQLKRGEAVSDSMSAAVSESNVLSNERE